MILQPITQVVGEVKDRPIYRLHEDYIYQWEHNGRIYRIIVPREFRFDKASVPHWAWSLIQPSGLQDAAAAVHDWLYYHNGKLPFKYYQVLIDGEWQNVGKYWNRHDADRLFARILRDSGAPKWRRRLMFQAVDKFGWQFWNKKNEEQPLFPLASSLPVN